MLAFRYTALATLGMIGILVAAGILVARARDRYGIKAPATTGNDVFERTYRVQMNTLEQAVAMLPALWLMATWVGDRWAGLAGLVWIVGRVLYITSYIGAAEKRGTGFAITFFALAAAWLSTLVAIAMSVAR